MSSTHGDAMDCHQLLIFLLYPTSWRSVRNFKTRTVISPQSGLMVMMHEGHYVQLQNSSSSFLFFRSRSRNTLCQTSEMCAYIYIYIHISQLHIHLHANYFRVVNNLSQRATVENKIMTLLFLITK